MCRKKNVPSGDKRTLSLTPVGETGIELGTDCDVAKSMAFGVQVG